MQNQYICSEEKLFNPQGCGTGRVTSHPDETSDLSLLEIYFRNTLAPDGLPYTEADFGENVATRFREGVATI